MVKPWPEDEIESRNDNNEKIKIKTTEDLEGLDKNSSDGRNQKNRKLNDSNTNL